jgi:hypothetical protein
MGYRDWKFENFEKSRLEWKFGLIENLIKAKDELEVKKDEPKKNIFINLRMEVWPMNK